MNITTLWIEFAIAAALIGGAGAMVTRSADVISVKTGLPRSWIGLILLAFVTSLPELVTSASAVTVADAPNIAVGEIFGSCVFNLVLLSLLDFLHRRESVYRSAAQGHRSDRLCRAEHPAQPERLRLCARPHRNLYAGNLHPLFRRRALGIQL